MLLMASFLIKPIKKWSKMLTPFHIEGSHHIVVGKLRVRQEWGTRSTLHSIWDLIQKLSTLSFAISLESSRSWMFSPPSAHCQDKSCLIRENCSSTTNSSFAICASRSHFSLCSVLYSSTKVTKLKVSQTWSRVSRRGYDEMKSK